MTLAHIFSRLPLFERRRTLAFGLAVALSLIAFGLRLLVWPVLGPTIPYITFLPAIVVAAFLLGMGPAILAGVVAAWLCWYFMLPPLNSFRLDQPYGAAALGFFAFAVAVDIFLVDRLFRFVRELGQQADKLKEAQARSVLLAHELNHRVSNLFSVSIGLVSLTARAHPAAKPVLDDLTRRLNALARAHHATVGTAADATKLGDIVADVMAPYRANGSVIRISGPDLALNAETRTPIGLLLHELATNAAKHGALAGGGDVDIRWRHCATAGRVTLDWRETGVAAVPAVGDSGFGTTVIDLSARQLGGTVSRDMTPQGLTVQVGFPRPAP